MPSYPNSQLKPGFAEAIRARLDARMAAASVGILSQDFESAQDRSGRSQARKNELSLFASQEDIAALVPKPQWPLDGVRPVIAPVMQAEQSRENSQDAVGVQSCNPFDSQSQARVKESHSKGLGMMDSGRGSALKLADLSGGSDTSQAARTSRTLSGGDIGDIPVIPQKPK